MKCPICTPWNRCEIGDQLWLVMLDAQTKMDWARSELARIGVDRKIDLTQYSLAVNYAEINFRAAEAAFRRHVVGVEFSMTLDLALERILALKTHPDEMNLLRAELRRLYAAAGEPLPAALGGSVTYSRPDVSGTSWTVPAQPWLYTAGCAQEPELAA